jgi:MoaA/NifB/PqqE/SkfB family radical SAM enzyme
MRDNGVVVNVGPMNGEQLYGVKRFLTTLRMGMHPRVRGLPLRQKLALNYASGKSKMTRIDGRIYTNTFTPYYPSTAYDRYLDAVIRVGGGEPVPVITNFAVTPRCPCCCWHCSFAHRAESELGLDTLRDAISGVQELGTSVVGLTGGEPLLRDDLEEIIHSIGDRSMPLVFTTGHQLTRERVRALAAAGLGVPVISLDHYRAEVHDRRRGRKGVHAAAVKAIELFREEGFYVAVSFVPDRELIRNPSELERTLTFFRELGVNDMRLTSPILSGHLTARHDTLLSQDDVQAVWEIQERLTQTPGEPGVFAYDYFEHEQLYGCGAGYNYLFIDAEGNACPCDFAMLSFGNIKTRPIADIWRDTSARFRAPGRNCYANVISDSIAACDSTRRPLDPKQSQSVIDRHPPFDRRRLPLFYKKFGLKLGG